MLLEERPDPGALIAHAAQMGENPFWLITMNNEEVHPPLQGDTSIGANENEWMRTDDFLHSGMETDTGSASSGRRRVGDEPR